MRSMTFLTLLLLAAGIASPVLRADCTPANKAGCVIAPAITEINLAALPVDRYQDCVANNGTIPHCPDSTSVRDCIKNILNNYNYINQGATGVRFFFGLGGGAYSTPFNPSGHGLRPWLAKLDDFLKDVHEAGYTKVTPIPVLEGFWSAGSGSFYTDRDNITSCGVSVDPSGNSYVWRFLPWLPFGLRREPTDPCATDPTKACNWLPDCQGKNNAYKPPDFGGAVPNTYNFWGWDPVFNLMDFVFQKVKDNNLTVADFDIHNELDLLNFTVEGRLIYDNVNSVDVVGTIRTKMVNKFGPGADGRVTFSTQMTNPASPFHLIQDCGSYYGDSAMIIRESERLAAFGNARVGQPANLNVQNNLPCEGTQGDMILLGVLYTQPTVTNIHAHVCFASICGTPSDEGGDATSVAKNFYSDVWTYLKDRGLTGNKLMFGEVNHTQIWLGPGPPPECLSFYDVDRAYNNVNGFRQSTLYTDPLAANALQNTVLRVWQNIREPCYTVPNNIIKPPYGPP